MEVDLSKWEYLELKITRGEVEVVDGDFVPPAIRGEADPFDYVKSMIADGWELVTRSGTLNDEFSVMLKRPLKK
jgi:hypothetical protein